MRIIIHLFWVIIVTTTTRPILAIPRPTFVGGSHNNPTSPRSGSLNATVSLAMASGARTSNETTSKIDSGAVFLNPEAATLTNTSYTTPTFSSAQQNSQWSPGGISTVVFGCIASILGMLASWATIWLGNRHFNSNSMPRPLSLLPKTDAVHSSTECRYL